MSDPLMRSLTQDMRELNNARHMHDQNWIAECYGQIAATLSVLSDANTVTTVLEIENTLIAGEQNGIKKASGTHKTINIHLKNIARAQEADAVQEKHPRKYHSGALPDYADRHHGDGTPFDTVRATLADCRKHMKDQITAIGADENEPRRQGNILRHDALFNAERTYIERQVAYQENTTRRKRRK